MVHMCRAFNTKSVLYILEWTLESNSQSNGPFKVMLTGTVSCDCSIGGRACHALGFESKKTRSRYSGTGMSKNQPELKLILEQVVQMQASYMQVCLHVVVTRAETEL